MIQFPESDWKLFREKLPSWQEAYMERLCSEYAAMLSSDRTAGEKFWELTKRVDRDRKKTGVIAEMRRSQLVFNLVNLVGEGAIGMSDLKDFSEELQTAVRMIGGFHEKRSRTGESDAEASSGNSKD